MPRTPEQVAADDALTEAIKRTWRAYWENEPYADSDVPEEAAGEGVMMEYMVIGTMASFDKDGEPYTHVFHVYKDGDVPIHRLLGMLEYARLRLARIVQE